MKHPKPLILPPLVPAASEQQGSTEFLASSRLHPESALSPALASTTTASDRILLRPEVLEMVGIGRTTLYKMVKAGTFPAPLNLTARIRGWRLSAVLRFLDSVEDK
ncbi:helix-turn-helix transcriptional regulator [Burkholderia pseudomallei]|uniref:helix-turn-helix transcriptional regulator n=1 Tax=Burkholderia pseudomallei TaxID=28450 RepID=UPI0009AC222D|nr:AlpA family phage regulatory protein [Burkholderia pseudomallei]RXS79816.1 AlpA family phage regulatory protein [Burkholderia pseudomallei]